LNLAGFSNPKGLEALGSNLFLETPASGPSVISDPGVDGMGTFRQGYVEESSVDPVKEVTDLIEAQRGYELNSVWAAGMVQAEILVASRVIPANTIIKAEDVRFESSDGTGAVVDPAKIIGMEARKALFAGRPISIADVGTPAIVQRNQVIQLVFRSNGLLIRTDGQRRRLRMRHLLQTQPQRSKDRLSRLSQRLRRPHLSACAM